MAASQIDAFMRGKRFASTNPDLHVSTGVTPAGIAVLDQETQINHAFLMTAHESTVEELRRFRRCIYCYAHYQECDNIGQFRCRAHPGVVAAWADRYTCCGELSDVRGCCACDHSEVRLYHTYVPVIAVPAFLVSTNVVSGFSLNSIVSEQMIDKQWLKQEIRHRDDIPTDMLSRTQVANKIFWADKIMQTATWVLRFDVYQRQPPPS